MVCKKYRSRIGFKIQICQPPQIHRPPPGDFDKKDFFKKKHSECCAYMCKSVLVCYLIV